MSGAPATRSLASPHGRSEALDLSAAIDGMLYQVDAPDTEDPMNRLIPAFLGALSELAVITGACNAAESFDPKTAEPLIDMMRQNPNAVPLDPRDPTRDVTALYRDCRA